MASFASALLSVEDVDSLPYSELRKIAKQLGIRANQKAEKIRSEIKLRCCCSSDSTKSNECDVQVPCVSECANSHKETERASPDEYPLMCPSTKLAFANITRRNVPVSSSARNSSEQLVTEDEEEFASLSEDNSSSTSHVLNRTYELIEPTILMPAAKIPNNENSSQPTVNLPQTAVNTSPQPNVAASPRSGSQFPPRRPIGERKRLEVPAKPLSSVAAKLSSGVRTVPDFSRIHAAAANRMESLVEYADRRKRQRLQTVSQQSPLQRRNTIPYQPVSTVALFDISNRPVGRKSSSGTAKEVGGALAARNTIPHQSVCTVALSDISNRPVGRKSSSGTAKEVNGRLGVTSSSSVLLADQKRRSAEQGSSSGHTLPIAATATSISADSAFSRRKAYDLAKRRQRLSGTRTSVSARPGAGVGSRFSGPKDLASSGCQQMATVADQQHRRRRTELAGQQQQSRVDARQALVDARRGLLV